MKEIEKKENSEQVKQKSTSDNNEKRTEAIKPPVQETKHKLLSAEDKFLNWFPLLVVALLALSLGGLQWTVKEHYGGDYNLAWTEVRRLLLSEKVGREPGVRVAPQNSVPVYPVTFTVHFNGDGLSNGLFINSTFYYGIDDILEHSCLLLTKDDSIISKGAEERFQRCKPSNGCRLYTHDGVRVYSLEDIKEGARTYVVPQGVHFVYPLAKVGSVIIPGTLAPELNISLIQLSEDPRVFTIENFVTAEEMKKIIEHNEKLVKPSEVGFSGWRDRTRTSHTAWDFTSWASKKLQQRAFDLLTIPYSPDLSDSLQVLRYNVGEWYKPHTDWFDAKGYVGHDPTVNNGTNRFATLFLYLTDVPLGGETVFPLSTTHDSYVPGSYLTHAGTNRTAGYISDSDAAWVCNASSKALRVKPVAGNAVLFYNQGPRGELDKNSLHGACPVLEGVKWGANVWVWNRPKPSKELARDKDEAKQHRDLTKQKEENGALHLRLDNTFPAKIDVFWDDGSEEMVFQMTIEAGEMGAIQTYEGHAFVARDTTSKKALGRYVVEKQHDGQAVTFNPISK